MTSQSDSRSQIVEKSGRPRKFNVNFHREKGLSMKIFDHYVKHTL